MIVLLLFRQLLHIKVVATIIARHFYGQVLIADQSSNIDLLKDILPVSLSSKEAFLHR